MTTVAYQGEPGAFGEEAIIGYFGADAVEPVGMSTFSAVCDAVEFGSADAGVLPLENSLAGTVGDALDALAEGSLTVVGELLLPVRHHLLVLPGVQARRGRVGGQPLAGAVAMRAVPGRAGLGDRAGGRHGRRRPRPRRSRLTGTPRPSHPSARPFATAWRSRRATSRTRRTTSPASPSWLARRARHSQKRVGSWRRRPAASARH